MHDGDFDRRIGRKEMPSHRWAKENASDLDAISRLTEAEQALAQAVDKRNDSRWSKVHVFREAAENDVRTATHNLAVAYLESGVSADEPTALQHAGKALDFLDRCRREYRPDWAASASR